MDALLLKSFMLVYLIFLFWKPLAVPQLFVSGPRSTKNGAVISLRSLHAGSLKALRLLRILEVRVSCDPAAFAFSLGCPRTRPFKALAFVADAATAGETQGTKHVSSGDDFDNVGSTPGDCGWLALITVRPVSFLENLS
ncbi:hypothetical protein [Planktotalea arctica]|uniref:hypothetical protein n=1 Tax=Planktotalea arctica TaxID=1481893 RepID=UPI00111BDDDA|nr:hypothetical protein [Planktotalea arctica]